jgi:diguanylate cyclase (GGDEF)-like protein
MARYLRNESSVAQRTAKGVRYRGFHDGLTSLPNAKYFRARLEQAIGRREPPHQSVAVLCVGLDLEDFKLTLDTFEHDAVDKLLKMIAAQLAAAARAEDMLSRMGKDRFAYLVPGLRKRDELSDFARHVLGSFSAPLEAGRLQLCLRPSIGIAIYPRNGTNAATLLMNAELAMCRAKQYGTGHAFADER